MKNFNLFLMAAAVMLLSSCSIATGIFKGGVAIGIIIVIIIIAVIFWILSLFRNR